MAIMVNCAVDWTFDKFAEDMNSVKALPMRRGVRSASNLTEGQKFCQQVKTWAKFFKEDNLVYGNTYTAGHEYIGDAFKWELDCFSDWYKDIYGQRPHFPYQYISILCGLPVSGEIGFCGGGYRELMQDHIKLTKMTRKKMEEMAE